MFEARKELIARLESAKSENTDLRSQIETLNARLTECSGLSEQVAELTEDLSAAKDEIAALSAKHNDALSSLQSELTAAQSASSPEAIAAVIASAQTSEDESQAPIREALNAFSTAEIAKLGRAPLEFNEKKEAEQSTATGLDRVKLAFIKQLSK